MNFLTALNHVKHCCYMPIAWQCQALIESFCHRGQTQSWWGALRKQSFCYWGQTQAWLYALNEQPNFWTRAIRMWNHNASHRANRKLWLRALSVLAYFVRVGAGRFFWQHHKAQYTHAKRFFWGNSPKYFRHIPGRMGSHRPIISASAHTSRVILHHTVFNWTLRQGSILFTIYQSVLHSRYCL